MRCKCFRDKDFNVCRRACPVMCNEPIRGSCSKKCVLGCDCPPGFLRDPTKKYRCVKAAKCVLKCPQNSKFQFCVSTCAPKCGARPPKICVTRCQRAGCVCDQGYAEVEQNGETMCVPQGECYRYLGLAASLTPGGHANMVVSSCSDYRPDSQAEKGTAQSSPCGCLEVPASGSHQKEKFCRPNLTPLSERTKPRSCICRPGLVRNAWGDCITKKECLHCKCTRDKDFNVCARKCPLLCNEPILASCSQKCVLGCDCPPGTVRVTLRPSKTGQIICVPHRIATDTPEWRSQSRMSDADMVAEFPLLEAYPYRVASPYVQVAQFYLVPTQRVHLLAVLTDMAQPVGA
ncbi:hypothetical protein HPB49_017679 [Dermacentor silvarum]|uniref:Uncharacterized protein n=1 Tax=Dermacentor silvarum TaxID=543639 RepID=A0ACB8C4P0_DERSI|nr:hypothetical protein HPB49_017679 [Dermacentor silvarum]